MVGRVRTRLAGRQAGSDERPGGSGKPGGSGGLVSARLADVVDAVRAEGSPSGGGQLLDAARRVASELAGLGPLQPLVDDPEVTDVLVNGPTEVWVERAGRLARTDLRFTDEANLRALAQRLAATAGRRLDDASPYVDAVLPGQVRLHAVLPPVASPGPLLSLRTGRRRRLTLDDLVASGCVDGESARVLTGLVGGRVSVLVTGPTGSGKTTVLETLLGLVAPDQRVVVVEDGRELWPDHPHVVHLSARPPNAEGAGGVSLSELVRQALRMRPDRIVVGEVRGAEVLPLMAALTTGHDGSLGTVHANGSSELPARLEALALAVGMDRRAVHAQIAAGLGAVVHLARDGAGRRYVREVGVPVRRADGLVEMVPGLTATGPAPQGRLTVGPEWDRLEALLGPPQANVVGPGPPC
jgi:pilus assembly protein CpaF